MSKHITPLLACGAAACVVLAGCQSPADVYHRTGITPALAQPEETYTQQQAVEPANTIKDTAPASPLQANVTTTVTVTATAIAVIPQNLVDNALRGSLVPNVAGTLEAQEPPPEVTWQSEPTKSDKGSVKKGKHKNPVLDTSNTPTFTIADDNGHCLHKVAVLETSNGHPDIHYTGKPHDKLTVEYLDDQGGTIHKTSVELEKQTTSTDIVDTTIATNEVADILLTVKRRDHYPESCLLAGL